MGNRYTKTSLTSRQMDTLRGCIGKIKAIMDARSEIMARSDNENLIVIINLADAADNLEDAIANATEWTQ